MHKVKKFIPTMLLVFIFLNYFLIKEIKVVSQEDLSEMFMDT